MGIILLFMKYQRQEDKKRVEKLTKKYFDNYLFIEENDSFDYVEKAFKKEVEQRNEMLKEYKFYQQQTNFILESINRGVAVISVDHIIFHNSTFIEYLSLNGQILYEPYHKVFRSYDLKALIAEAKKSRTPIIRTLEINKKKLQVRAVFLKDEKSEQILLIIRDLQEYHLMESVKRDFFSYASHELKTPITAIKGYAELIYHQMVDEVESRKLAEKINESASFMTLLVDDMLMLSRLEYLKDSKRTEINLNHILNEVLHQLENHIEEKHIHLELNIKSDITYLADRVDMFRLFKNLIENGVKYNKINGKLSISLQEENNQIIFTIKDSGIGIADEHIKRVFERFYRINQGREKNGTGLGLAIVKHIVLNYQGEIQLNTQLGEYTEFIVQLPKKQS